MSFTLCRAVLASFLGSLVLSSGCYLAHGREPGTDAGPIDGGADGGGDVSVDAPLPHDTGDTRRDAPDVGDVGPDAPDAGGPPTWAPHGPCGIVGLGRARDLEVSPDRQHVAIAPTNEAVRIVRAADGAETLQLLGHPRGGASRVRFTDAGFVTLAADGIRWFDGTGTIVRHVEALAVRDLDALPDGEVLTLQGTDVVRLDADGDEIGRFSLGARGGDLFGRIELSPDGNVVAVAGRIGHRTFALDGTRLGGVVLASVDVQPPIAWSPDSRTLAIVVNATAAPGGTARRTVWLWGVDSLAGSVSITDSVLARAAAFTADGRGLVVAREDGVVRYDLGFGPGPVPTSVVRRAQVHDTGGVPVVDLVVAGIADGERMVLVTERPRFDIVRLVDDAPVLSHVPLVTVDRGLGLVRGGDDGRVLSRDGLWSIATDLPARFDATAVAARADGRGYARGTETLVEVRDADDVVVLTAPVAAPVTHLAFSPDGRALGVLGRASPDVRLDVLDLMGGAPRTLRFMPPGDGFSAIAVDDERRHVALGFAAFAPDLGAEVRQLDGALTRVIGGGHASTAQALAFVPGAEVVAALNRPARWLAVGGTAERTLEPEPEDARAVVVGHGWLVEGGASRTWVRDAVSTAIVDVIDTGPVDALAIDEAGRIAVGSSAESIVRLYCAR